MEYGSRKTRGATYETEREVCEAIQTVTELANRNKFPISCTYEETYDGTLYDDNTPATSPNDYKGILLWGRQMDSNKYYVKQQQQKAFDEHAPIDALYCNPDGRWTRVS